MEKNGILLIDKDYLDRAKEKNKAKLIKAKDRFLPALRYGMLKNVKVVNRRITTNLPLMDLFNRKILLRGRLLFKKNEPYMLLGGPSKREFMEYLTNHNQGIFCKGIKLRDEVVYYELKEDFKVLWPEMINSIVEGYLRFMDDFFISYMAKFTSREFETYININILKSYDEEYKKTYLFPYFLIEENNKKDEKVKFSMIYNFLNLNGNISLKKDEMGISIEKKRDLLKIRFLIPVCKEIGIYLDYLRKGDRRGGDEGIYKLEEYFN